MIYFLRANYLLNISYLCLGGKGVASLSASPCSVAYRWTPFPLRLPFLPAHRIRIQPSPTYLSYCHLFHFRDQNSNSYCTARCAVRGTSNYQRSRNAGRTVASLLPSRFFFALSRGEFAGTSLRAPEDIQVFPLHASDLWSASRRSSTVHKAPFVFIQRSLLAHRDFRQKRVDSFATVLAAFSHFAGRWWNEVREKWRALFTGSRNSSLVVGARL